jgi:tetratricopeptide (TPR) repeat protein
MSCFSGRIIGCPTCVFDTEFLLSVGLDFVGELDRQQVSARLYKQFELHGITLTLLARVEARQAGCYWMIVDADKKYLIQSENQTLNVYDKNSNDPVDRLNASAEDYLARREYSQAQHCAEEAIQLAGRINPRKKGCSIIRLAEVYRAYGQHQHAIITYQRAADDFEMRGDDRGRVITLSHIIELHHDHQEWDQVTESCQLAMDLARRLEELSNGDGNTEKGKEYQDWQYRFKKVLEHAFKQYVATSQAARHNG